MLAILAVGCSTLQKPLEQDLWSATGKVQFRDTQQRKSYSATFNWVVTTQGYRLHLAGPLNMGSVLLERTPELSTITLSNGESASHPDANTLIEAAVEQPVPIDAISAMLTLDRDDPTPEGLDDWQISRRGYRMFDGFDGEIASKIDFEKDQQRIKVVIKSLQNY